MVSSASLKVLQCVSFIYFYFIKMTTKESVAWRLSRKR